jgi:nucleotide-binding universal stress UspA family protein
MKILVPVDGSRFGRAAIAFVASRSTLIGADPQVELLNVQPPVPVRAAHAVDRDVLDAYYETESGRVLKSAQAALTRAGVTANASCVVGKPGEEIAAAAAKRHADLIVMASHGHSVLRGLLLGSVTRETLARTARPMLIVRSEQAPPADSLKVGIAIDGSRFGRAAVRYVLRHQDLFGATPRFILIHVAPDFLGAMMPDVAGVALPMLSAEEIEKLQTQSMQAAMAQVRTLMERAEVEAERVCLSGEPGEQIAAFAKKRRLDLLVMGSHGYGRLKTATLGSVAIRVAARCTTPLLLIRRA